MPGGVQLEGNDDEISFVLNGEYVTVEDPDPSLSLGDYLRRDRRLKGLQLPCRQGGCGACTVLLSSPAEFHSKGWGGGAKFPVHRPINSCLRPLCSVDGMAVTTVEGVGSTKSGLHPVQEKIVKSNGTQCGFCTPGMVSFLLRFLQQLNVWAS
jgi:xanthine dehydrogenase iron-sulfur cluster and FAD-binding subunit A